MKKFIPLVVVGMMVLCGLEAVALPFHMAETDVQTWKQTPQKTGYGDDELDQSQLLMDWFGPVGKSPIWGNLYYIIAQTFTPTKNLLTRVELFVGKNSSTTYDYTVGIRDDLNGSDLASVSVPAAEISTENFSWIEFDFPDVMVTPGQTYFIVSSTVNASDNWYAWGLKTGNVYPNGTAFWSTTNEANWSEDPTVDLAFKTYGKHATVLDLEITGGIGVSVSTKNIGDINATNVKTQVTITGGILGLINLTLTYNTSLPLTPGNSFLVKVIPLGLGPITIIATARADNAVEVTKTVDGLILFFFVIMK